MKQAHYVAAAVFAMLASTEIASAAGDDTQWIKDSLSDQCSAAARDQVANATRQSIEQSIARAEASMRAPASVAEMSCLGDLLGADIDVFSDNWMDLGNFNITDMINGITGGLKSGLDVTTLAGGVQRAICGFAEEQFAELTSGVTGSMDDITSGIDMPSFTDGFGSMNIGYNTNAMSSDVTENQTPTPSSVTAPTPPTTQPSSAGIQAGDGPPASSIDTIWNQINGGSN